MPQIRLTNKFNDFETPSNTARRKKSRRIGRPSYKYGKKINASGVLVEKPEGMKQARMI
jgi:hypothetical protein